MVMKRCYRTRRNLLIIFITTTILLTYFFVRIKNNAPGMPTPRMADLNIIRRNIERHIEYALMEDKGRECIIPKLNPFAREVTQFDRELPPIKCSGIDWVKCYLSDCRVVEKILTEVTDIQCEYKDIIYESDIKYSMGPPVTVVGDAVYRLVKSDHVKVSCTGQEMNRFFRSKWSGNTLGFRPVSTKPSPAGRESSFNVLILAFDSTAKNGFIRRLPKSYKYLHYEMDAVILNGYNIVGDGTTAALLPILTGKTELELPDVRKAVNKRHSDSIPLIFYTLRDDGYRTAYFEDMPWIGTFQNRFNGFQKQPTDHYLRAFFQEEYIGQRSWWKEEYEYTNKYCVGDTAQHVLMLNATKQFFDLDKKKYCFTFIADITHDDFNMISAADENLLDFLKYIKESGILENTLFLLMGDHGPRYAHVRNTLQGKQEERLPLMSFVLPEALVRDRPIALENLKANAEVLTTPFDIHSTLLDVIGLLQNRNTFKVTGSDLPRSLSLLDKVPSNRSCSEAGIEPHWCSCMRWENVSVSEPIYAKTAYHLVNFINELTEPQRSKCVLRSLRSIEWVLRQSANSKMLAFKVNKDKDNYLGLFGEKTNATSEFYQVKIIVNPGNGAYEASMKYNVLENNFDLNTRDISRTNAYGNEPNCISSTNPHLNMFCYCEK